MLLPSLVVTEVCYFLGKYTDHQTEATFLLSLANHDFEIVNVTDTDFRRAAELVVQYADFPLGATDASVIAVAERLGVTEIATLDHRHFSAVRPEHTDHFTLRP